MSRLILISIALIAALSAVSCNSCSKETITEGNLVVIDSLDTTDDIENGLDMVITIDAYKESIYAIDLDQINEYKTSDLSYVRTIGREGKGPGEFNVANDFCVYDDTILVCDAANSRIQLFDLSGNLQMLYKFYKPFNCVEYENRVFISTHPMLPEFGLYEHRGNNAYKIVDLEDALDESNREKKERQLFFFDNKVMLNTYIEQELILYINEDSIFVKHELSDKLNEMEFTNVRNVATHGELLYLIVTNMNINKKVEQKIISSKQLKTLGEFDEFLLVFDKEYNLIEKYYIPDNIFSKAQNLVITDNFVFLVDTFNYQIYKLKMEN